MEGLPEVQLLGAIHRDPIMTFAVWTFSLTLFCCVAASTGRTGLELVDPPPGSENVCLASDLTFRCTTTGQGDALLIFERDSEPVGEFRFRHSIYMPTTPNQELNGTRLGGKIRAGDLLRSDSVDCNDSLRGVMDYCYTTSLVIIPTNTTLCGVVVCRTAFNNGSGDQLHDFGSAVIVRTPPQPTNLSVTSLSSESLTLTWEAGTSTNCLAIAYEVTTTNCGNCSLKFPTMYNNITCKDLVAGQTCSVSVRSTLECGVFSNISTREVVVPEAPPTTEEISQAAQLAIGLGVSLPLACIAVLTVVGVIAGVFFCIKRSLKRAKYDVVKMKKKTKVVPTMDEIVNHSKGENEAKVTQSDSKDHIEDTSFDRLLPEAEISLNVDLDLKVPVEAPRVDQEQDPKEPIENPSVNQQQPELLPPSDQIVTPKEADEKQSSVTNGAVPEQPSSIVATEYEGELESHEVSGDAFHPSVQSIEESTVKEKSAALVTFSPIVKTTGVSSQQEHTANFRDVQMFATLPSSVQIFPSSATSGKHSASSFTSEGDSMTPDDRHELAPKQSMTESGRPLSQDSELSPKDGEEEASAKRPVASSEDGPSQAIAIDGKGAQKFTDVAVSCPANVADILKKHEKRLTNLEACQLDSNTKIDELNAQILSLTDQLETMRINYAALEKESEEERQRHLEKEKELTSTIEQLKQELEAEKAKVKKLENEKKIMPKKALSTETNTLDTSRPGYQRTKSCPAQTE